MKPCSLLISGLLGIIGCSAFRHNQTTHYFLIASSVTWDQGNQTCASIGGSMADLRKKVAALAVEELLGTAAGANDYWIGLKYCSSIPSWCWFDESPATYYNWKASRPANSAGGQCAKTRKNQNFEWWDEACTSTSGVICEIVTDGCRFSNYSGQRFVSSNNMATSNMTLDMCMALCYSKIVPECLGINFAPISIVCELVFDNDWTSPGNLAAVGGWNYYLKMCYSVDAFNTIGAYLAALPDSTAATAAAVTSKAAFSSSSATTTHIPYTSAAQRVSTKPSEMSASLGTSTNAAVQSSTRRFVTSRTLSAITTASKLPTKVSSVASQISTAASTGYSVQILSRFSLPHMLTTPAQKTSSNPKVYSSTTFAPRPRGTAKPLPTSIWVLNKTSTIVFQNTSNSLTLYARYEEEIAFIGTQLFDPDDRLSAKIIGNLGVVFIIVEFVIIFLLDISNLSRDLRQMYRNLFGKKKRLH